MTRVRWALGSALGPTLVAVSTAVLWSAGPQAAEAGLGDCGQPASTGDRPTATDAFFALKSAVGSEPCPLSVCDVDRSGTITVSDAWRILKAAVGAAGVTLDCPLPTTTTVPPPTTTTLPPTTTTLPPTTTTLPPTTTTLPPTTTTLPPPTTTLGGVNQPPEADAPRLLRVYPGVAIDVDIDAPDPDGDTVTFSSMDLPPGATLDAGSGRLQWTPTGDDIGTYTVTVACTDDGRPPQTVDTVVAIVVQADDSCVVADCDPATGCTTTAVAIDTDCCAAEPVHHLPEPDIGCLQSALVHVGRNSVGFGRLQNCDFLRLQAAGQGGTIFTMHVEARCLDASQRIDVRTTLETATQTLVNAVSSTTFQQRGDGFVERRSLLYLVATASPASLVGTEAQLTVRLTDHTGAQLERTLRVVLTTDSLSDLPDPDDGAR